MQNVSTIHLIVRAASQNNSGGSHRSPPARARVNPRPHMLFPHPRTHMGGCNPHAISSLIKIELWGKDQTNYWDVLNPMVPELTSFGHILTPPGRVKEKSDLRICRFSQITFELRKIVE